MARLVELAERHEDRRRNPCGGLVAPRAPCKPAVGILESRKGCEGSFQDTFNVFLIECHCQALHLFAVGIGGSDKRRLRQYGHLEILVLFELTYKRRIGGIGFPYVEDVPNLGEPDEQAFCSEGGVGRRSGSACRFGFTLIKSGKGLYGLPHRVLAILHGDYSVAFWICRNGGREGGLGLIKVKKFAVDSQCRGFQNGNKSLFAIGKLSCRALNPVANHRQVDRCRDVDSNRILGVGRQGGAVIVPGYNCAGRWVENLNPGGDELRRISVVDDCGEHAGLVALTQETWQRRLYHHRFRGYQVGEHFSRAAIFGPCSRTERPRADCVWNREAQCGYPCGINGQVGHPECL